MVCAWRRRFNELRVDGLYDEPRLGAPRKIGDEKVEELVRKTLEEKPEGATHWSTRTMAEKLGKSQGAVSRIWRTFGLRPHRSGGFTLSTSPLSVEKVRDIVSLYMSPPANALVLCVDETSQIQALQRSQPAVPTQIGQIEFRTHDYLRYGATTLFAAPDVATDDVLGKSFPRHRSTEFLRFITLAV